MIIRNRHIDLSNVDMKPTTLYRIDTYERTIVPFEIMGRYRNHLYYMRLGELAMHKPDFKYFESEREAAKALLVMVEEEIKHADARLDTAQTQLDKLFKLENKIKEMIVQ